MKLLIVDDHSGVRKLIREMVTLLASEIRECADGEEAVLAYPEFMPDFVIMDLQMPKVDGFEATRRILARHSRARVVAVSHLKHPEIAVFAKRAGACHFVQKENLSDLPGYLGRQENHDRPATTCAPMSDSSDIPDPTEPPVPRNMKHLEPERNEVSAPASSSPKAVFRGTSGSGRLEDHLLHAQRLESLGAVACGIAHELKNILLPLTAYAEFIQDELQPDHPAQSYVHEMQKAGRRANDLVKQILTFSRHQESRLVPVELNKVISEASKLLRSAIPATFAITMRMENGLPQVLADTTQIHQIVLNLGINAWQAAKARFGSMSVELDDVTLHQDSPQKPSDLSPGRYVRLVFRDNGKGMDEGTLGLIFEPFFTSKANDEGTGLGLPIVLGIVKNHSGAITVESTFGKGTVFQIYFPVINAEVNSTAGATAEASTSLPSRPRVLLVDDEFHFVELVSRFLRMRGFLVEGFTSSDAALKAFRLQPRLYNLILSDISMPGALGLAFTRKVLSIWPDAPVALFTGCVSPHNKREAERLGVRHFLSKPETMNEMAGLVAAVMDAENVRNGGSNPPGQPQ